MPLIVLLFPVALADRILWATPPTPADLSSAARVAPGARSIPLAELGVLPAPTPLPAAARAVLLAELATTTASLAEFDGELRVMARLQKALGDIHQLESGEDATTVWRALVVQGYAVQRYYQDQLPTDQGAAPYRSARGTPAAWEQAVALAGAAEPLPEDLTQAAERLAFDAVRATTLADPAASIVVSPCASGATVEVDGRPATVDVPAVVTPGRHFVRVIAGGVPIAWADPTILPGATFTLAAAIGPEERHSLVVGAHTGSSVPAGVGSALTGEPTWLGVPGRKTMLYRVDRGTYERAVPNTHAAVEAYLALGAGWLSTGDFYRLNRSNGAPRTSETVNAFAPALAVGGELAVGSFAAGIGADVQYALGDWHSVPTGEATTNTFVWLHGGVGLRWVQVQAGPIFPWHFGMGGQVRLPLAKGLQVVASGVYGVPISDTRTDGSPFDPDPIYGAWAGLAYRLQ